MTKEECKKELENLYKKALDGFDFRTAYDILLELAYWDCHPQESQDG